MRSKTFKVSELAIDATDSSAICAATSSSTLDEHRHRRRVLGDSKRPRDDAIPLQDADLFVEASSSSASSAPTASSPRKEHKSDLGTAVADQRHGGLDPDQSACALHSQDKALLIIAGAGSGKTETVAQRIAFLVQSGVRPYQILGLSFSRASAEELRRRVARALPPSWRNSASNLMMKTIHGFCLEVTRRYHPRGTSLTLINERQRKVVAEMAVRLAVGDRRDGRSDSNEVRQLLQYVDRVKCRVPRPGVQLQCNDPLRLIQFDLYEKILHEDENACDFGDLQRYALSILTEASHESACAELQKRFTHIIVDEAQDIDEVQYEMLCRLAGDSCRVTCVGDPRQAIYGFRGAASNFFDKWAKRFMLRESEHVRVLRRNYRSTAPIVEVCNAVACVQSAGSCVSVRENDGDVCPVGIIFASSSIDMEEQLHRLIVSILKRRPNLSFRDIGVLVRTCKKAREAQQALSRRGVPCQRLLRHDPMLNHALQRLCGLLRCVISPYEADHYICMALQNHRKGFSKNYFFTLKSERLKRSAEPLNLPSLNAPPSPEILREAQERFRMRRSYFGILEWIVDNKFLDERLSPNTKAQRKALQDFVDMIRFARATLHEQSPDSDDGNSSVIERVVQYLSKESGYFGLQPPTSGGGAQEGSVGQQDVLCQPPIVGAGLQPSKHHNDEDDDDGGAESGLETFEDLTTLLNNALRSIRGSDDFRDGPDGLLCALVDILQPLHSHSDFGGDVNREAEPNAVSVATVHRAKGLEWPVVVVFDVTDGEMPLVNPNDGSASAEEKRVFYVALSRAKEELYVIAEQSAARQPSRYLHAIAHHVVTVTTL